MSIVAGSRAGWQEPPGVHKELWVLVGVLAGTGVREEQWVQAGALADTLAVAALRVGTKSHQVIYT